MLHTNPIISDKVVKSVQRDYYQAAEGQRLLKAGGYKPNAGTILVNVGLAITTIVLIVFAFTQFQTV
jgi:hypothetical protein